MIKVGMVGDAQIGKTSLMVKYVEGSYECVMSERRWTDTGRSIVHRNPPSLLTPSNSEDYIQTLGVNFMEKVINIRNTEITFSVSRKRPVCPKPAQALETNWRAALGRPARLGDGRRVLLLVMS